MKQNILYIGCGAMCLFLSSAVVVSAETYEAGSESTITSEAIGIESDSKVRIIATQNDDSVSVDSSKPQPALMMKTEGGVETEASKLVPVQIRAEDNVRMIENRGNETEIDERGSMMEIELNEDGSERGLDNAMMRANENAEEGLLNAEFHVNVRAMMKDSSSEESDDIQDADDVHTSVDFEHFVAHKAKSDSRLSEVSIKDKRVEVKYNLPVKFFGFWGATIGTKMRGDIAGNVEVDYPWYAIFTKKMHPTKDILENIQSEIADKKTEMSTEDDVRASATTTVIVRRSFTMPHVFDAMVQALSDVSIGDK